VLQQRNSYGNSLYLMGTDGGWLIDEPTSS
jgi:hypothetical protein